MQVYYIKEAYLDKLKTGLKDNKEYYYKDSPWLDEYFESSDWCLKSKITCSNFELKQPISSRENFDVENSILIHQSLDLNISQANDERLWVYLTHITFYEYMKNRWGINQEKTTIETLKKRCYFSGTDNVKFARNGIARLWWAAEVTKDNLREDPYELTRILFSTQDVHMQLMERNFSRNTNLIKNILSVFSKMDKKDYANMEFNRDLMKYLNSLGGVTILDALDEEDIEKIIKEKLGSKLIIS
ncbi:DUF6339 family protein [Rossellomorea sp. GAMAL-10_SWC]